ncbi:MAG: hypothetical protein SFY68_10760, partial [Candidatus Sumerlaeia bacterium]|nr:hypothetical protein [Candidatus Sumerlaeia bacterium]
SDQNLLTRNNLIQKVGKSVLEFIGGNSLHGWFLSSFLIVQKFKALICKPFSEISLCFHHLQLDAPQFLS